MSAGLIDERREGRMMMYNLIHDGLNDSVFAAIGAVPMEAELAEDHERLVARLARRVGGECLVC